MAAEAAETGKDKDDESDELTILSVARETLRSAFSLSKPGKF